MRDLKVLHFNYSRSGGSGMVASSLVQNQKKYLNYEVNLFSIIKTQLRDNIFQDFWTFILSFIDNFFVKNSKSIQFLSLYRNRDQKRALEILFNFEGIVHLHWINGMLTHKNISNISEGRRKVVWTLHDMEFFTGGCHYALNCDGFKKDCANCPIVNSVFHGAIEKNYSNKFLNKWNTISFVVPSLWMKSQFQSNPNLSSAVITVIPNPIDECYFDLFEKSTNRNKFNIPEDAFVVGFVSAWVENPLKGYSDLLNILLELSKKSSKEIILFVVGKSLSMPALSNNLRIINYGEVKDFNKMGEIYSTFDINISLSRAESFGLTVAEAMAVGVPSLVLNTSASTELIQDGKTGLICESLSEVKHKLIKYINGDIVLNDNTYMQDFARKSWHPKIVVNEYHRLYKSL